jgi:antitoxin FitA
MAAITVRNLDEDVQRRLKLRAAAHNQSMEAEARAILSAAVRGGSFAAEWVSRTSNFRGEDLDVPPRSMPRDVDLS